jgi:hypothetical protein
MKIKLRSDDFKQYNGTIIDVDLDEAGDAPLPEHIADETGRTYAFPDEFDRVNENVIPGGYTLGIQAKDLIQLHAILDVLPEYVLASAELHKN